MEATILERLGIALNFVAVFLIAPELVGKRNWQRLQDFIESRLRRLTEAADSRAHPPRQSRLFAYLASLLEHLAGSLALLVTGVLLGLPAVVVILVAALAPSVLGPVVLCWAVAFVVLSSVIEVLSVLERRRLGSSGRVPFVAKLLFSPVVGSWFWLQVFYAGIGYGRILVARQGFRSVAWAIKPIASSMRGEGRLSGSMVGVGIALFIVGTALQFAATFGSTGVTPK